MKRNELKTCQCGGRPAWVPAERERRRGRSSPVRPERLQCPACGNRTCSDISRESLAAEWNSAGWRGQGPDAPEYVPFGPEWRAQCARMRKADLIGMLADACRRGIALDGLVARLRGELAEADRVIARLRVKRNRRELAAVVDRLVQRGVITKADAAGAKRRLTEEGEKRSTLNAQRSTPNGEGGGE